MTDPLKKIIAQYIELEKGVQELVLPQCKTLCQQCGVCCCDAIICEEGFDSAFLKLVHQQADEFSDSHGFLSETGCILPQGRPPVCYAFFCTDLLYLQPDELHEEILQILGALPNHATLNALGDSPLSDLRQNDLLDQLNFQGLEKQFQESFQALEIIRTFYDDGTLPDASYRKLKTIELIPQ